MTDNDPDDDGLTPRLRQLRANTYQGPAAVARLRALGLEEEDLVAAVNASEISRRGTSPLEPPGAAGSRAWFDGCRVLAERLLVRDDWERVVVRNLPRMVNAQTRISLVVSSGDAAVGLPGRSPRSKNEKGNESEWITRTNERQMALFDERPRFRPVPRPDELITWVLLIYSDDLGGTLRAELSMPTALDDTDRFSEWQERIILNIPRFDGGLRQDLDDDGAGELEVTVRPRA